MCTGCGNINFMLDRAKNDEDRKQISEKPRSKRNICVHPWHIHHENGKPSKKKIRDVLIKKYPHLAGEVVSTNSNIKIVENFNRTKSVGK